MLVFDASSLVHAWDNYPPNQFPPLWEWMANNIKSKEFATSQVAFEEVGYKISECASWLDKNNILKIEVDDEIIQESMQIKSLLGINGDVYHPKGVDENDILIIATAKHHNTVLISDEAEQKNMPKEKKKMKIPAVCLLPDVSVKCNKFIELIKSTAVVFG